MSLPRIPLAAIQQPAFLYGPDGRIAAANDLAETLAGRPVLGMTPAEVFGHFRARHPGGIPLPPAELPVARALAGEETVNVPLTVTAAYGRTIHVLVTASPIREGDRIAGALSIWQDVSALETALAEQVRLRTESELRAENLQVQEEELRQQGDEIGRANVELDRQRRLLDAILGRIPYHVNLWSADGRYLWMSDTTAASIGRRREDLVGRTWQELGVDAGVMAPFMEEVRTVIATGVPLVSEAEYPYGDGPRWREYAIVPFPNADGTVTGALSVSHDITERKRAGEALRESEERLRLAQESANIGVWDWDVRTNTVTYTPEFLRLYGLEEGIVGSYDAWRDCVHPDDIGRLESEREAALVRGEPFANEFRIVRPSGEIRWLQAKGRGITDEAGRLVRVLGVNIDITARKDTELELAQYAESLCRSNEELQRFAYVASHDLQEPLRSIVSFSQLLERRYRGKLGRDADEYIDFIVEGGNRMQSLIHDLLQVSRVETRAQPAVPTDANGPAEDALCSLDSSISDAGATVTVDPLPVVMADPAQLEQVFVNLVGNAIKYRHPRRPLEVRVSAERQDGMVEFAVADNGIGIEAEYFDRIFEMFRRLHTREAYPGTGIGLAVAKKIIERHGGRIRVESTPGEGSTFFFTLPAA